MIPNRFVGGNRGPLELREGSKTRIDINIRPWICEKYYTIRKDGFRDEEAQRMDAFGCIWRNTDWTSTKEEDGETQRIP